MAHTMHLHDCSPLGSSAQRAVQVENEENLVYHSVLSPLHLSLPHRLREWSQGVGRGCQRSFCLAGRGRSIPPGWVHSGARAS